MEMMRAWFTTMRKRSRWVQQVESSFDQLDVVSARVQAENPGDPKNLAEQETFKILDAGIAKHLAAGRALQANRRWMPGAAGPIAVGPALERMHAIEDLLLRRGSHQYVMGHLPSIHASARDHLKVNDPQRIRLEKILQERSSSTQLARKLDQETRTNVVLVSEAAHEAYQVEYAKLRNFVRILWTSAGILVILTVALGIVGSKFPTVLSPCFVANESSKVVCLSVETTVDISADSLTATSTDLATADHQKAMAIEAAKRDSAKPHDIFLLEFIGLIAAAFSGASSLRRVSGSSTPYNPVVALAFIKLPVGAITAVLGLMLFDGGVFPGLTALDSSGQILAWAILFGASQQLLTGLVDQKAKAVLDNVGSNDQTDAQRPATA